MTAKPSYSELEHKIKKLEKEALEYVRKEKEFTSGRKLVDYSHMKRTISLLKINEELGREIKEIKSCEKQELERISHKLRGRVKELNCLYEIKRIRENNDFSLDGLLQEMVDSIPPACQHPDFTCARIILDGDEFATNNFFNSRLKASSNINVHNKRIGILEVCHLDKTPERGAGPFIEEEKNLFGAIAESISRIVEREWAEAEIRKCRNKIENLIKQTP